MNEKQGKLLGLKSCLNKSLQRLQNDDELTQEECAVIINELEEVKTHIDTDTTDVLVTGLDAAYHYLCQILGKEYQEDLIDHMFRNFCLGK